MLETASQRRITAAKALLNQRLGDAVRFRAETVKPLDELLSSMSDLPLADIREPLPPGAKELTAQLIADYQRRWLDLPVPALDDRTPRAGAQTFGGRIALIRLLKEFERMDRAEAGGMDVGALKRELGLSDEEFLAESDVEDRIKAALDEIEDLAVNDEPDEALAAWRKFRETFPIQDAADFDFAQVWALPDIFDETVQTLANLLGRFQRFAEGIAVLEDAIRLNADDPDVDRAEIAEMKMERGDLDEGLRELEALAARNPDNFVIALTLAGVQKDMLNRTDDAIATLQRLREQDIEDFDDAQACHEIEALLLDAERFDEADAFWRAENDPLPEVERDWAAWTKLLLARGNVEAARESASRIEDESVRWHWTGRIEAQAGNVSLAREAWADQLTRPEEQEWYRWHEWLELHLRLHDPDTIIGALDPQQVCFTAYCYYYVAMAHAMQGDLPQAAEVAQAARVVLETRTRRSHQASIVHDIRRITRELRLSPEAVAALGLAA